ncbi:MAG: cephalosporin hydroxylase family protein [Verrucomicrobia bacterium]|nr:cephalosporin hydroxylase family protein [Verrucomicrobiota bacterium]MBU4428262.1 cephalosporin hydroxylase family protein [Verrucomicrobiota bacterium]MCG2679561.1 cephalosporin hydroxylase family protein [Kiritimatiellia bacterium]
MRDDISPLRKYVAVNKDKDELALQTQARQWICLAHQNKLSYEIDWLGVPIIQTPEDMVLMQELLYTVRPDILIETGIAHGGSLIYYASLFELIGKGLVIGIDREIRPNNRAVIDAHAMRKRIVMIEGDSVSDETLIAVRDLVPEGKRTVVCLDADHTKQHVLRELDRYHHFVDIGSYLVVFDTCSSMLAEHGVVGPEWRHNGPKEAVAEFLNLHKTFAVDTSYDKLYVSHNQGGFLKRIA